MRLNYFIYIFSVLTFLLFSCGEGDEITFEDPKKVSVKVNQCIELMNAIEQDALTKGINWDIDRNKTFDLDPDQLFQEIEGDRIEKLRVLAYELYDFGICGAAQTDGRLMTYAFLYRCDIGGFDPKQREIYLKDDVGNMEVLRKYTLRVILDETDLFIMGY